ncbi:VOC family protein, partial [Streptomyces sp. wa22]|uniref:VOC family protein n=1 Tax=Streptomyces sp. wa22 TaxID=1828244 RepID=UPI0012C01480
ALHGVGHGLPRDRGPHWMTYFQVADTDEAAARVVELGGHVLQPPREAGTVAAGWVPRNSCCVPPG